MFKQSPSSKRVARRLIVAIVLFSTLITLITSAYQLYGYYKRDLNTIESQLDEIETVYLSSIAAQVWVADQDEMRVLLQGVLNIPNIVYIEILEEGKTWLQIGEMQSSNRLVRNYPIYYSHRGEKLHIGDLYVQATLKNVYKNLYDQAITIIISNGIKTFFVTGFMFLLFEFMVTRHLHKIAGFANTLTVTNLDSELSLDRKKGNDKKDELDVVVNAIQRMQINLSNSLDEIKKRETQLSMYEKILSTTSDKMAFVDKNYTYLAVNQAYCDFFNKKYDDIVNRSVTDLLGEDYFLNIAKSKLDRVFKGEQFNFETVVEQPDKAVPVEITYLPYYGESDEVQGAVVNVRNISERVRHNHVYRALARTPSIDFDAFLKDSLQLLAEVLSAKYTMVGRLDDDKVTSVALFVNNQIVDNISYDIDGTPCKEVIRSGSKMIVDDVSKLFPDDVMLSDLNIKCYFGAPLINTQGETIGLVVVMDDKPHTEIDWYEDTLNVITARIAMEMERADALRALDQHRKNLENEVETRTADLKLANRELESFAYSVSHDLRTPLRAINGFAHILAEDMKDELGEEGLSLVEKICASSEKMSGLIDSMLSLSRIRRQELDLQEVDISKLCQSILDEHYDEYDLKNFSIDIKDGIKVYGDSKLLKIALDNLIRNALKFSADQQKPRLRIGEQQSKNGHTIIFVEDNGIGFDMSYSDKLFKPFQRLHDQTKYRGYGIGLATVNRIVERHGGRIWADSKIDEGTTVYFELGKNTLH